MNDVFLSSIYDCIVIPIKDQIPKICSRIKNTSFNNVDVEEKFDVTNKQKAHLAKFNTSIFWGMISNCGFIIHSRWFMLIIELLYKYSRILGAVHFLSRDIEYLYIIVAKFFIRISSYVKIIVYFLIGLNGDRVL